MVGFTRPHESIDVERVKRLLLCAMQLDRQSSHDAIFYIIPGNLDSPPATPLPLLNHLTGKIRLCAVNHSRRLQLPAVVFSNKEVKTNFTTSNTGVLFNLSVKVKSLNRIDQASPKCTLDEWDPSRTIRAWWAVCVRNTNVLGCGWGSCIVCRRELEQDVVADPGVWGLLVRVQSS